MRAPLSALLLLPVAACAPRETPRGANLVTITASDFAFAAPDTIPSGLTTFRMINKGQEPHQAVIAGASGRTWEELEREVMAEGIPNWLTFPAGPGVVVGGDSSNATAHVTPGHYLILCFIPSPDGTVHASKGMVRRLVVVPAPPGAAAAAEPDAHFTIRTSDYAFALSAPLVAGTHTIRVENAGPQLHEVGVERLAPGKTLADWRAWVAGGMKGEGPAKPIGGVVGPDTGKVAWFTVTLTPGAPGTYLLTCYVPDAKDQRPHVLHGMVQEITVN